MSGGPELLRQAKTILLVDWPSREVPDSLARHGFTVVSRDGEAEDDYNAYEVHGEAVRFRAVGHPPVHADLVYTHRPLEELPRIIEMAKSVGASAIWVQTGRDANGVSDPRGCWADPDESRRARELVEGAGLAYIERPYIVEALGG